MEYEAALEAVSFIQEWEIGGARCLMKMQAEDSACWTCPHVAIG